MNRRQFLVAVTGGTAGALSQLIGPASASESTASDNDEQIGVLVDTTKCIGCRKCEYACARATGSQEVTVEQFENMAVFERPRRMTPEALTVVNRYDNPVNAARPIYIKIQCLHCLRPCCVSACIVGALHREQNGAVSYDAAKCIGCRYCMLACPFEVPTYEYKNVFTPMVKKCTFCYDTLQAKGEAPACVQMCPPNCFTFAKRSELLKLAHAKIEAAPDNYCHHVYGETEAGGTSWLYLTSRPATELGLLDLPDKPLPQLPETLQHSIFKYGIPPILLYGFLLIARHVSSSEATTEQAKESAL
jgi:Fe-S-cluster-containing dehydrogenase component